MSGKIYFLQIGVDGPIKIGFTKGDPLKRMNELQCGCPWPLRLLGSIPGTKFNEGSLQVKFSKFQMLREWFQPQIAAEVSCIIAGQFSWSDVDLSLIDRAILLAGGSQCDLSKATGCHQPTISAARRSGKVPKRVREFIASHQESAA